MFRSPFRDAPDATLTRTGLTVIAGIFFSVAAPWASAQSPDGTVRAVESVALPRSEPGPHSELAAKPKLLASGGFPAFHPQTQSDATDSPETDSGPQLGATPLITVTSSLAVVLGLFAALVWATRKYGGKSLGGSLPGDLVELLGTRALDARTKVQLIRVGGRVIIAAQTSAGLQSLGEITDASEVNEVLAACGGKSKTAFAATLKEIEQQPAGRGFADPEPRPRRKLFASA